jgi:tetratricopeptide (TPR) repeat protein
MNRLALIKLTESGVTTHRAIQAVTRAGMGRRLNATKRRVLSILAVAFPTDPFDAPSEWQICEQLYPHIQAIESSEASFSTRELAGTYCRLLNSTASWLHAIGEYEAAQRLFEKIIGFGRTHGSEAESSSWLNNLALVLWEKGEGLAARKPARQSIRIGRRILGPGHPLVATRHNNLALIEEKLGHYRLAELHYSLALRIRDEVFGPSGDLTINTLSNYGDMLRSLGRHWEAELLLERAVKGADHDGANSLRIGQALNALSALFLDTDRPAEAVQMLDRAEELFAATYPPGHPALLRVRNRREQAKHKLKGSHPRTPPSSN